MWFPIHIWNLLISKLIHIIIRLSLWHLKSGTLFLRPSSQQHITFNLSRPAFTDTFDSYPIAKSLLIFTIQGSTADYRGCYIFIVILILSDSTAAALRAISSPSQQENEIVQRCQERLLQLQAKTEAHLQWILDPWRVLPRWQRELKLGFFFRLLGTQLFAVLSAHVNKSNWEVAAGSLVYRRTAEHFKVVPLWSFQGEEDFIGQHGV